jgi:uncharacterized protein
MTERIDSDIAWRDWDTPAFSAAQSSGRPVLLWLCTDWAGACRHMAATTFRHPAVVASVESRYVPVYVDADARPDIADRYGLGAWPTTLALTPEGEVLGGGTFVEADRLLPALEQMADILAKRRVELGSAVGASATHVVSRAAVPLDDLEAAAVRATLEGFDASHGGFGTSAKVPLVAPLRFALRQLERQPNEQWATLVSRTLDAMTEGELWDAASGGFFRACATRAWTDPDRAKLLDVNAELARCYLEAWAMLGDQRYRDRALDTIAFLRARLLHDGAFTQSDVASGSPPTFFLDANSRAVRALALAARLLDAPEYARVAVDVVERLVPAAYARGAGVAHYIDARPHVRGLLADQVLVSVALLDVADVCDRPVYTELAEELMRSCLRKLWDQNVGGLVDRIRTPAGAGDVGRLAQAIRPTWANAEAAGVLARLAERTGSGELADRAKLIVHSLSADAVAAGLSGVDLALVRAEIWPD